ncbi:unnamed protein product [Strongylus vulgaris]|uniref:Uncharacterized protein n=1 Tax=Strongylus vulgaris TaxID=40348 RepID=A0A3P7JNN1_STRVU|nr:unnamed protein product [Strongylus vulgaris]
MVATVAFSKTYAPECPELVLGGIAQFARNSFVEVMSKTNPGMVATVAFSKTYAPECPELVLGGIAQFARNSFVEIMSKTNPGMDKPICDVLTASWSYLERNGMVHIAAVDAMAEDFA